MKKILIIVGIAGVVYLGYRLYKRQSQANKIDSQPNPINPASIQESVINPISSTRPNPNPKVGNRR